MKYGIRTCGQEGAAGPADWPALTVSYQDGDTRIEQELVSKNFTLMSEATYLTYIANHQAEYDAWAAVNLRAGLEQSIRDQIDTKTDEIIDAGFTYQTMSFKLDLEHQNSYMFDYLLNQTYPHIVKGVGNDYITFGDHDEHTTFIATGFGYVDNVIRTGWNIKDNLVNLSYAELLAWTDPRG